MKLEECSNIEQIFTYFRRVNDQVTKDLQQDGLISRNVNCLRCKRKDK